MQICTNCHAQMFIRIKKYVVQLKSLAHKPDKVALALKIVNVIEELCEVTKSTSQFAKEVREAFKMVTHIPDDIMPISEGIMGDDAPPEPTIPEVTTPANPMAPGILPEAPPPATVDVETLKATEDDCPSVEV